MSEEEAINLDWQPVPSADPVEQAARALCIHEGRNPDLMVPSEQTTPVITKDGIAELGHVEQPLWKEHVKEAARFVAVFPGTYATVSASTGVFSSQNASKRVRRLGVAMRRRRLFPSRRDDEPHGGQINGRRLSLCVGVGVGACGSYPPQPSSPMRINQ